MSVIDSAKLVLAPPHPAGRPFLWAAGAIFVLGLLSWNPIAWLGLLFGLFCLYFFRDPPRVPSLQPGAVLAPADGLITRVDLASPPPELALDNAPRPRICIFLSVLDVHVNRIPASGTITRIAYRPGTFLNASLDKASEDNERNAIALRLPGGEELAVVQIAGLIARRILCDIHTGDTVAAGARFGIIRFGSRVDLYLPPGVIPAVRVGQTMIGGETVVAQLHPLPA